MLIYTVLPVKLQKINKYVTCGTVNSLQEVVMEVDFSLTKTLILGL